MKTQVIPKSGHLVFKVTLVIALILSCTWACEFILPNKPPYVLIDSPTDGAVYNIGETVSISITAYDVDGDVKELKIAINGAVKSTLTAAPYTYAWNTANHSDGTYVIQVTATDNRDEIYVVTKNVGLQSNLTASAGPDITITTNVTTVLMQAAIPEKGEGTWQVVSGVGGSFSDIHDPRATFNGQACQTYVLRWTVATNASQVSDDVTVKFFHTPSQADAGPDFTFNDGRTTVNLQAVTPVAGTGQWSIVSGTGGSLANPSDPATMFTGLTCQLYQLKWKVSTNCSSSEDIAEVRFNQTTTPANAGSDQSYTDGRTTATLAANTASGATGTWSVVSGSGGSFSNVNEPRAVFTGQLCQTYILRWTLVTACGSSADDVSIGFQHPPSQANAGNDMVLTNGQTSAFLSANNPAQGEGVWSIVSGQGGSLDDSTDPNCRFTGQSCQTYVLRWTISTLCDETSDTMTIHILDEPTVAYAGPDKRLIDGSINVVLEANVPANGTGTWSVTSGTGGSFDDVHDPAATFTGVLCQSYILRWTITTPCDFSFDECEVTFNDLAIPADAGADQHFSDGTVSTTLNGNAPELGQVGYWSIEHGAGATLSDVNDPHAMLTGQLGQVYRVRWTVNGTCATNFDEVYIAFLQAGTFVDERNSKVYQTIRIGSQTWMAENLNYTVTGSWNYSDQESNLPIYGKLYTHAAALTACPSGWHLPTDAEWRTMEKNIGMPEATTLLEWYRGTVEGGHLKEAGYSHWLNPNAGANDLIFFKALPGGYRTASGVYGGIRSHAGFWTGTTNGTQAIYRALHKDKLQIGRDYSETGYAFSVRCVKN